MAPELPYGLLIFSACLITVSALVVFAVEDPFTYFERCQESPPENDDCLKEDEKPGILDSLLFMFDVTYDVATFNIDGAPWWIRFPLSLITIVPWVYIIAVVIIENLIPFA